MKFNGLNSKKSATEVEFNFSAIGCYLIPLIYFVGNLVYIVERYGKTYVSGYYLIHYIYTHDHGYISRGLVGEIISWFYDSVSAETLANIVLFFNVCLAISCSLYIGKAFQSVRKDKYRFSVLFFIVLVFFVFASPVNFYYEDIKLDKILWTLTFIAVILAQNKIGICFVPAICIIATMVNPIFLFCSMILVSIILLQEFYSANYSVKNGIICGIAYISMIVVGLIAPISEKYLGFATPTEMVEFYFSRYDGVIDEYTLHLFETEWLFDYFEPLKNIFRMAYEIYFLNWGNGLRTALCFSLMALPAYCLLIAFWKKTIDFEENKFQKFIFFLCLISPVVIIPPVLISWEFSKYFYNNVLMQVGLIIYFLVKKSPALLCTIKEIESYFKTHILQTFIVLFYFITYIAILGSR